MPTSCVQFSFEVSEFVSKRKTFEFECSQEDLYRTVIKKLLVHRVNNQSTPFSMKRSTPRTDFSLFAAKMKSTGCFTPPPPPPPLHTLPISDGIPRSESAHTPASWQVSGRRGAPPPLFEKVVWVRLFSQSANGQILGHFRGYRGMYVQTFARYASE